MGRETRRQLLAVTALCGLLGGGYLLRGWLGIEWSAGSVRDAVQELGVLGPLFLVALLTFRSLLVIPSQILLVAAGLCFGAGAGTAYGVLGLTLSGVFWFGLVRFAGREAVVSRVPPRLRPTLDAAGSTMGVAFLFLATAYPFGPMTAWHAGAGLTGIGAAPFLGSVAAGAAVRSAVYTYFGSRLLDADLSEMLLAAGVLAGAFVIPLLFPPVRRRIRAMWNLRAPEEEAPGSDPGARS